jgi:KH/beta-lactamase-domain protein
MPDILKTILDGLPPKTISNAIFEGANIVVYTEDKDFFLTGEEKIREVVNKIKKRIELRATGKLVLKKDNTEQYIKKIIPKEAEISEIIFDEQRSIVIIEVKKPGMAIGKGGEILRDIKEKTLWIPQVRRSPSIKSKITEAIRQVLYVNDDYRKKFLNSIGKRIYKEWNPEKKEEWVRVTFLGAGRQVGRSCLLLQTPESKILLDCGIDIAASNSDKFPYLNVPEFNIKELDAVIITHAHLDHSGLVPYLYKLGYRGPVYMTAPTRDIAALLALDFIGVSYKKAQSPLFKIADIKQMVKHSIEINYNEVTDITPDVRLTFYNAGHTLGSAMVHFNVGNGLHNLIYTGDHKYAKTRVLDIAATKFPRLETFITEATYGSKQDVLPSRKESEQILIDAINKTIKRKGKILVPVLGVGRAQEIMMIVKYAYDNNLIPKVPIYVDGLVWDVTAIHTAYPEFLSPNLKTQIFQDKNPFISDIFKRVGSAKERKEIIEGAPCVILATSGMLVGGASLEYFRELCDNRYNNIVFVSYQGQGSLGRQVIEGIKEVHFFVEGKEEIAKVKMEIIKIDGLTGHSGRNEILNFINNLIPSPHRIIINHGEQSKCLDLASTLYKLHHIETTVPRNLETIRLK